MKKAILVFNVGSSSIKYSLFQGLSRISSGENDRLKTKKDYQEAINKIFKKFENEKIDLIAHRIVHGGEINQPSRITKEIKNKIKEFSEFAPLHNPKQLMTIELIEEKTKIPQYALFDTMFFSELPEVSKNYALPKEIVKKYNIRRYGFQGLSHKSASQGLKGKTITCHLGSGSSVAAIKDGKPIDTSMGLTPIEGLIMGTRCGSIDPGIVIFLEKKGYNTNEILTKKSGLKGICGYEDFRDILKTLKEKNSKLAYDMFTYQIIKVIGSYVAALNGLDNLVFAAAIGENVPRLRRDICNNLRYLGLKLDEDKNKKNAEIISSYNSKVKVFVKKTDEERIMVEEVLKILR